jgi:hypothetical protein
MSSPSHKVFRKIIESEFTDLEMYIYDSLEAIKKSEGRVKKTIDISTSWEENPALANPVFIQVTPFLFKHSLFISVYSFWEFAIKKFSLITIEKFPQYKRRVANLEKAYQFYSYFIDELKLNNTMLNKDWESMNIFRDIRNSIIHHNSYLGKNISLKSQKFIKSDPRIHLDEFYGFKIQDDGLILELMEVSKNFVFTLIDEYDSKYIS